MEKIFNKLVRDKIPEIIKLDNATPIISILSDEEYKKELEIKLLEEYNEVLETKTSTERIEELADMLEVIISLAKIEKITLNDLVDVANNKKNMRGGFDKKLYLKKILNNCE